MSEEIQDPNAEAERLADLFIEKTGAQYSPEQRDAFINNLKRSYEANGYFPKFMFLDEEGNER